MSQFTTLLNLGILIIKTLRDVMEFPSKVLRIRMKTWSYLWRCVNAYLLKFFYATSTQWKCANAILTADNHAIVFRKKPEIVKNIWMHSRILQKCSRIYWMDCCICIISVAHTEAWSCQTFWFVYFSFPRRLWFIHLHLVYSLSF